jgi:hypothetical protein
MPPEALARPGGGLWRSRWAPPHHHGAHAAAAGTLTGCNPRFERHARGRRWRQQAVPAPCSPSGAPTAPGATGQGDRVPGQWLPVLPPAPEASIGPGQQRVLKLKHLGPARATGQGDRVPGLWLPVLAALPPWHQGRPLAQVSNACSSGALLGTWASQLMRAARATSRAQPSWVHPNDRQTLPGDAPGTDNAAAAGCSGGWQQHLERLKPLLGAGRARTSGSGPFCKPP